MIASLLIANRGEIACRIRRTAERLGVHCRTLYTPEDRDRLWARCGLAVSSYLAVDEILQLAQEHGLQAIHPGFGFLAENADFARRVQQCSLTWVGPSPEAMERLGSKSGAKEMAARLGLPTLPGYQGPEQGLEHLAAMARELGFPLMIKAAAGGGGKGMRLVTQEDQLQAALQSARGEAERSFGDGRLLLERKLEHARHLEVQILGDVHGQVMSLGVRDCSLQRRHQKILEETPAPLPCPGLEEAALTLARAAGYQNAGTVEFLAVGEQFYFLEMNTRLQVEHPVTEAVTGLDLVEWQLRLAAGQPLPPAPPIQGHAMEVRLYAEDPRSGHLPCAGPLWRWSFPEQGLRVETGLQAGDDVSPHYDPMVAKLIVHGPTRPAALSRLRAALEQVVVMGIPCNRDFLLHWLRREEVVQGLVGVELLDLHPFEQPLDPLSLQAALAARWLDQQPRAWSNMPREAPAFWVEGQGRVALQLDPTRLHRSADELRLEWQGQQWVFQVIWQGDEGWVASPRGLFQVQLGRPRVVRSGQGAARDIHAPLTGSLLEIAVTSGQPVEAGQLLFRLEAMKMEHRLTAPVAGIVHEVQGRVGQVVQARSLLARIQS